MNGLRLFSVRSQFIARFRFALPADFRSYFLSLIYFLVFYSIHAMKPFLYSQFGLVCEIANSFQQKHILKGSNWMYCNGFRNSNRHRLDIKVFGFRRPS